MNTNQTRAVTTFGKNVCVNAGAGSGKTSVLVGRFVHSVTERGDAPDRILALTFTEPAANHMKRRLVEEFTRLGRENDRRALETAYIGTIHSFCARLLRENPIEAAVDPYFTVLSKAEADILMTKAMDAAFESQTGRPEWLEILVDHGEDALRQALLRLYAHFRATGEGEGLLTITGGQDRKKPEEKIIRHLAGLASVVAGKKELTANEAAALAAARNIPELFAADTLEWDIFNQVRSAGESIHKKGSETFKEWVETLKEGISVWTAAALQDLFVPKKTEFLRVFREFTEQYKNQKLILSALDFDDLPLLAWQLLKDEAPEKKAVRERYRARFKHLLVDELQDTSTLQGKIIDLLMSDGNLFVVGDPQQSIYAFRHVDPDLFTRYEKAAGEKIRLDTNYRSRSCVLDFVNSFFGGDSKGVFQPLVAGKVFNLKNEGSVEVLTAFYGKNESFRNLEEAREEEARLLAERIRGLVSPGGPIRLGDVAVLFRSATQMPVYERAFAKAGVPFYSPKSKVYFEKPEVKDLISLLALLDHPDDDVSLAAALRSPLAGISDDGLFLLAQAAKKDDPRRRPLARAFEALETAGLSDSDYARAASLRDFLDSTRTVKNRSTVSAILDSALRWSDYEAVVLAGEGGVQKVANVRKLLDIARSLEQKSSLDAAEFVRYARGMAERDEMEEARVETRGSDAVFLSSIHAAKGLEFPCVALANLGGKRNPKDRGLVTSSVQEGLGWAVPDPENEKQKLRDASYEGVSSRLKEIEEEEEDRVLYVAMTRAMEYLILCGSAEREQKKSTTWMTRVLEKAAVTTRPISAAAESFSRAIPDIPPPAIDMKAVFERLRLPEKPYDLAIDLTVSDILARERGPAEEIRSEEPETIDPDDVERSPRNEYGTLFHRLMEITALAPVRGRVSEELAEKLLSPLTSAEKKEAVESVDLFWKSPLGTRVKKSTALYPELPFIFKTPFGLLKGQIDLVYRDDGGWVILDYKTNRIDVASKDKASSEYEFQLGLYALVFKKLYGEAPKKGVLYFSTLNATHEWVYTEQDFSRFEEKLLGFFRIAAEESKTCQ